MGAADRSRKGGERTTPRRVEATFNGTGAEQAASAEQAEATLRARRSDGGTVRGRRASASRNASGRTGGRNTGRRTSPAEAGSRRGLRSTVNRLQRRSGGRKGGPSGGQRRAINRPSARSAQEGQTGVGRGARSRAGRRTLSGARKAGKGKKR